MIQDLLPDVFAKIFGYLPLKDLAKIPRLSRRFKVLSTNEEIYQTKLLLLGVRDEEHQVLNVEQPNAPQIITAALPDVSKLVISKTPTTKLIKPKKLKSLPPLPAGKSARLVFKEMYVHLLPLYLDFETRSKDSKVFLEYQNITELASVLNQLNLFDKAHFLDSQNLEISFHLQSSIEWFESNLLGQFESAYDANDEFEMQKYALSSYNLNGGEAIVNLFISKNPVFFDTTFNPSLVLTNLPTKTGPAMGYLLSDQFAKYMDHLLTNCQHQVELVSKIFVPQVEAMTLFVNKVFEDSISEYLSSILGSAKAREDLIVFLQTLATSAYCCSQFVQFIVKNPFNVVVNAERVKAAMVDIFQPYSSKYLDDEMGYLKVVFDQEFEKFTGRVFWSYLEKHPNYRSKASPKHSRKKAICHEHNESHLICSSCTHIHGYPVNGEKVTVWFSPR
jgi:recyclin-1